MQKGVGATPLAGVALTMSLVELIDIQMGFLDIPLLTQNVVNALGQQLAKGPLIMEQSP